MTSPPIIYGVTASRAAAGAHAALTPSNLFPSLTTIRNLTLIFCPSSPLCLLSAPRSDVPVWSPLSEPSFISVLFSASFFLPTEENKTGLSWRWSEQTPHYYPVAHYYVLVFPSRLIHPSVICTTYPLRVVGGAGANPQMTLGEKHGGCRGITNIFNCRDKSIALLQLGEMPQRNHISCK